MNILDKYQIESFFPSKNQFYNCNGSDSEDEEDKEEDEEVSIEMAELTDNSSEVSSFCR